MKHLDEYRDPTISKAYLKELHRITTKPWNIMEICGGQTHGLLKNGIIDALPKSISMIHGPGCPVCVTPTSIIDHAIQLAEKDGIILCSFGDMLRVPGSNSSLLTSKAKGSDIRIVYSPLDALNIAIQHPDKEVVFLAVGFETTAPANALSVIQAKQNELKNYSILASQVLVPPAIEVLVNDSCQIDGILAAGHVCTIMGLSEYEILCNQYKIPIVVTGFEPVDLLQGILMVVRQLENGTAILENQYQRIAFPEGNIYAQNAIEEVFEISDKQWRGIGSIKASGFAIKQAYQLFDAMHKFNLTIKQDEEPNNCIAGQILKGIKKPPTCTMFGKVCKPESPLGAPMVSSEGACAAYYHYQNQPVS